MKGKILTPKQDKNSYGEARKDGESRVRRYPLREEKDKTTRGSRLKEEGGKGKVARGGESGSSLSDRTTQTISEKGIHRIRFRGAIQYQRER